MTKPGNMAYDLGRNAHDRLQTWILDTIMRCEVGGLPSDEAIGIILTALVGSAIAMCKGLNLSREDFLILMHDAYDKVPADSIEGITSSVRRRE